MGNKFRLFANETLGDVLCCVIAPEEEPDCVIKKGNLAILKKGEATIGYNLFGYKGGDPFTAINAALKEAGEPELLEEDEGSKTVEATIKTIAEHPLDASLSIIELDNGASVVTGLKGLTVGSKVAYLPIGGIAEDGELSKKEKIKNVDSEGRVYPL